MLRDSETRLCFLLCRLRSDLQSNQPKPEDFHRQLNNCYSGWQQESEFLGLYFPLPPMLQFLRPLLRRFFSLRHSKETRFLLEAVRCTSIQRQQSSGRGYGITLQRFCPYQISRLPLQTSATARKPSGRNGFPNPVRKIWREALNI